MRSLLASLALLPLLSCASAHAQASMAEEGLEEVFARVSSSVVTIYTVGRSGVLDATGQAATEEGIGSGVLIDAEGHVLTASHVVQTADVVAVEFADGTLVEAQVLGSVPVADVALLQLLDAVPEGVQPAPLGDSDEVKVASRVFVVGAPLGIGHTLTVGYVSARREAPSLIGLDQHVEVFQTDAAINQGNSGGPMFDLRGRVVGVVSFIVSQTGGSEGLGFAVSSNTARRLLLERGLFWSGMDYVVVAGPVAHALNVPDGRAGLLVQRVAKGSPGERLGLRGGQIKVEIEGQAILVGGDIVLEAFGEEIDSIEGLQRVLRATGELKPESVVGVLVLRGGDQVRLEGRVSELTRPAPRR